MNCPSCGHEILTGGCLNPNCPTHPTNIAFRQILPMPEWQLCPKCLGSGRVMQTALSVSNITTWDCDVCKGKKIINVVTGKPPEGL